MLNNIQKKIALELLDADDMIYKMEEIKKRMDISTKDLMIRMGYTFYYAKYHKNIMLITFIKIVKGLSEKGTKKEKVKQVKRLKQIRNINEFNKEKLEIILNKD